MASIAASLQRIKDNPLGMVDRKRVERICREHGYLWRERELDPATTIALFMQQVINGNTPCSEVRHFDGRSFTPQAYCQARARLPLEIYNTLFCEVSRQIAPVMSDHRWHGHRTFHIDGSSFSMPDTKALRKAFGVPSGQKPGCGFPTAHLLVLFNAATGLLIDIWASPLNTADLTKTSEAHMHLDEGDILIGDDSFSGYPHLAMLKKQGLHGLFPVHHLRIVDFKRNRPHSPEGKKPVAGMPRSKWIKSLGKEDQLVEYFKTRQKPPRISEEDFESLPDSMIVRELRRTVTRPGLGKITITLATTLIDPIKYPAEDLLELRLGRWEVETKIGYLKTTMRMDVLRCKTEAGIRKELTIFALVYNLIRLVMLNAAAGQGVSVKRVSFIDTYKWMRHARPGDTLPRLIINPHRPDRVEPRCRKRRPKQYELMNKPRAKLRKALIKQRRYA